MSRLKGIRGSPATVLFSVVMLCATAKPMTGENLKHTNLLLLAQNTPSASPSPSPSRPPQPSPSPSQSAIPSPTPSPTAAPTPSGQATATPSPVHEKETKETTRESTKEIKDRPSDLVEIVSALAWPIAIFLVVSLILLTLACSRAIQRLFGIATSLVQKIEIAGIKLEIDTSAVAEVKQVLGGNLYKLMKDAEAKYDQTASAASVEDRLRITVRQGLRDVLTQHHLRAWPDGLRATIHVPDIVFRDYMYQLVNYYPGSSTRSRSAGRRLSQRFGIVGRAWRLKQSMGRGKAISGPQASEQLIKFWGMQEDESVDQRHLERPANLCVILIDADDNDRQVGLLYVDSTQADAFGVDPPQEAPTAVRDAARKAASDAAVAVAQIAADAAAQQVADPAVQAAAQAVVQAANTAIALAADDATARAINHEAAEAATFAAARVAAEAVARAASDVAANAPAGAEALAANEVARAANNAVANASTQAATLAIAPILITPAITADQVAGELENHALTKILARAVNQAMAPLRGAGPELDVTNLKDVSEST